jgi:hypothetical protein
MEIFTWLAIFIALELITIFVFAAIYNALNVNEIRDYTDGLYLSVQIQTSIGMSENISTKLLKNWVTVQSIISDILNILLITFIGLYIANLFTREIIASEK